MGKLVQNRKIEIAKDRFRFLYQEIVWGFIIVFLFLLIPAFLIPSIIDTGSPLYGMIFYLLRAIFVFIGIPLIFPLANLIFESQKRKVIIEEDVSPIIGHLRLYKMTKKNYKYQILYGVLVFFLVFLTIDFLTYLLIPGMLEYQAVSLAFKETNIYLSENYIIFLIFAIVIQFSVAIVEETIYRGLLVKRGSEHFFRMSAVMISALSFGLGHFAYFLDPISGAYPIWYPFIWFLEAFIIIGIVLGLLVLRRKWLFPVIIAHALNNIVSAHAVWSFLQGNSFTIVGLYLYYPLLLVGCILFVWFYSQIKEGLSIGFNMLKSYFTRDTTIEKTKGDTIFRIFFDVLMALMIFIMVFLISI